MFHTPTVTKIAPALLAAQKLIFAATKDASNPFFKSSYADLNSVIVACKEALNNNGISVLQPIYSDENGEYLETILLHESGEFMASKMKLVLSKNDMQAYGSAVSYARRYSLQSMVFMGAQDDDGEKAVSRDAKTESTKNIENSATKGSKFTKPPTPQTVGLANNQVHNQVNGVTSNLAQTEQVTKTPTNGKALNF